MKTYPVVFRREGSTNVLAIFPYEIDNSRGEVSCYSVVDGWTAGDYDAMIRHSRPATAEQYQKVKHYLENGGQEPLVVKPIKVRNRQLFQKAWNAWNASRKEPAKPAKAAQVHETYGDTNDIKREFSLALRRLLDMKFSEFAKVDEEELNHVQSAALSMAHGFHTMAAQELESAGLSRSNAIRLVRNARIAAADLKRHDYYDDKVRDFIAGRDGPSAHDARWR